MFSSDNSIGRAGQAAIAVCLLAVILLLQWRGGAYGAEPATQGDEAAHVVTGLMVHDYLVSGKRGNPMRYAENYYLHYPQVALGHWPPVFYGVQALWMLAIPPSRTAILLLLAFLAAVICFRVFQVTARAAPWPAAFASALLLAMLAPMQQYTRLILAEMLLTWVTLEATLAFAGWLAVPRASASVRFGLWSAAAILTKATGAGIAFLPLAAIVLGRRLRLFAKPSLWIAALIVLALCVPWYVYAPGARHEANLPMGGLIGVGAVEAGAGLPSVTMALPLEDLWYRLRASLRAIPILFNWLGPAFLLIAWALLAGARRRDPLAMATLGLLSAFLIFRLIMMAATIHERLLLPVLPPLLFFLWQGCELLRPRVKPGLTLAMAGVMMTAWSFYRIEPKRAVGIQEVTQSLLARPEFRDSVFMLCSDANTEGALIAEIALHDQPRPQHYVLRSSKVMASSLWNGQKYQAKFHSTEEVLKLIQDTPVGVLIVDNRPTIPVKHLPLLEETIRQFPDQFRAQVVPGGRFRVYEIEGHRGRPRKKLTLSIPALGRSLAE